MILRGTFSTDRGDSVIYSVEDSTVSHDASIDSMVEMFNKLLNTMGYTNSVQIDDFIE